MDRGKGELRYIIKCNMTINELIEEINKEIKMAFADHKKEITKFVEAKHKDEIESFLKKKGFYVEDITVENDKRYDNPNIIVMKNTSEESPRQLLISWGKRRNNESERC